METWVRVEPTEFMHGESATVRGVNVTLVVSPYDVPEAFRGDFIADKKRFRIEFRYISDEPTSTEKVDEHVCFEMGKKSGRLYAIEIDVDKLGAEKVELTFEVQERVSDRLRGAFRAYSEKHHRARRPENLRVTQQILERVPPRLLASPV